MDDQLRPHATTKAAWVLLYWLDQFPEGLTQGEVAAKAGLEPSTITRVLDGLEAAGLVVRLPVPGDRRAKRIRLTQGAADIVRAQNATVAGATAELLADFSPEEIETVARFMQKLSGRLADLQQLGASS